MRRWSALSYDQLISRLSTIDVYEVEDDFKQYKVEIEILEKTEEYVHVAVSLDDGHLPASIWLKRAPLVGFASLLHRNIDGAN